MKTKKSMFKLFIQFFKFGIIGGINTLISLAIYYGLVFLHINYMIATACGYVISSLIGYTLNKLWVFQAKNQSINKSLVKYYIVYLSSLLLNIGSMYLWVDMLKISKFLAPILTLMITIPYNFLFSKLWVFQTEIKEINEWEVSDKINTEKVDNSRSHSLLQQFFMAISL